LIALPHHHQTLRLAVVQRLHQNRAHETEDRRVRADAERKREDGDESENGILPEHPRAVTHIL
jgi:hypothetical protein